MRTIFNRSSSFVAFINTFVENGGIETLIKRIDNPNLPLDATFDMFVNVGNMVSFIPRMDLHRYKVLYQKLFEVYHNNVKALTNPRI